MRFILTILCLIPSLAYTQPIVGIYENREDISKIHRLKLLDSTKFIKSFGFWLNHGIQDLSKGYFTDKNDTLVLHFEPYNRPKSWMEIIKKDTMEIYIRPEYRRIDKDYLRLSIEVLDEDKTPTSAMVKLNSEDVEVGSIFHAEPHFFYTSENNIVTELEINALGYKGLTIDLSQFRGTHSEIRVNLIYAENDTYRETFGEEKYVWRVRGKHLVQIKDDGKRGKEYSLISSN
jgi:hypothetical protein